MKTLRKVLFYLFLAVAVVFISLVSSVFLFKDKIINQFVREANKSLNTPVKIGKFDVSIFSQFPQLSIVLTDVYVEDSHPGNYPLLTAKTVSFQLNAIEAWSGSYTIKGLRIVDSETNLKINAKGVNNYDVAKKNEDKDKSTSIHFELREVTLTNTKVNYIDRSANQDFVFNSEELLASIVSENDLYSIDAEGELTTTKISVNKNLFFTDKSFQIKSQLVYDDIKRSVTIKPSTLELKNALFDVEGSYSWKGKSIIDLHTKGKDADIQTLLSLFPESVADRVEKYQSKGDVYFAAKLKGEISSKKSPSLSVDFGFSDATIFHPEYKTRMEDASMRGSFASPEVMNPSRGTIILKDIKGRLNGELFEANFILNNFENPNVICDFKGRVDAAAVMSFYPIQNVSDLSGSLLADISFEGEIGLLKRKATAQRVTTTGTIDLQSINFIYGDDKTPLKNLSGNLQFNNNDLALSNVTGNLGNSDFILNGFFKNVITFLLFENQPIGIETDLRSRFLDVDQLFDLAFGKATAGKTQEYEFKISKNINMNFNCDVKALRYKRFNAQQLKGDLLVKSQMAVSRKITFKSMGGDMVMSGIVDANNLKAIDVVTTFKLNNINVDSVFYVFKNFDQDFIEDKHLKGKAFADVNLEMTLQPNLSLFQETLIGDISVTIKNGELNNFEPMQKLNKYLDDEGLSKLRFSDLKNDIHIENKTVYIPQMEVRTNVTALKVSGTHTFDQRIDYRIVTPLRSRRKIDPQEAQDALEEENGQAKIYLKITGTTDDYKVQYDTEAVKKKIADGLKNEVKELKDAFKNKGTKKKKELELEKDEYFDW
ncbi:MAG: AsmA-like C-terminal region-containing protein [Chryseolinea sp.]